MGSAERGRAGVLGVLNMPSYTASRRRPFSTKSNSRARAVDHVERWRKVLTKIRGGLPTLLQAKKIKSEERADMDTGFTDAGYAASRLLAS